MKIFISTSSVTIDDDDDYPLDRSLRSHVLAACEAVAKKYRVPVKIVVEYNPDMGSMAFAGNTGFVINTAHFTEEGLKKYQKEWDGAVVDTSLRGIVTHELGHYLIRVAERKVSFSKFHRNIESIVSDNAFNASAYAQEGSHEAYAEAFVAHFLYNDTTHAYPKGVNRDRASAQVKSLWGYIDSVLGVGK